VNPNTAGSARAVRVLRRPQPSTNGHFGAAVAVGGRMAYVGETGYEASGAPDGCGAVDAFDLASGRLLWTVTGADNTFFAYRQPGFVVPVCEGEASPAGVPYGEMLPSLVCTGKRFAWGSFLEGAGRVENQAVFLRTSDMDNAAMVARKGMMPPLLGGGRFSLVTGIGVNASGHMVFRGTVAAAPGGASGRTNWTRPGVGRKVWDD
jgi:hypothetical protein